MKKMGTTSLSPQWRFCQFFQCEIGEKCKKTIKNLRLFCHCRYFRIEIHNLELTIEFPYFLGTIPLSPLVFLPLVRFAHFNKTDALCRLFGLPHPIRLRFEKPIGQGGLLV